MLCFERLGHGVLNPDQAHSSPAKRACTNWDFRLGAAFGIGSVDE